MQEWYDALMRLLCQGHLCPQQLHLNLWFTNVECVDCWQRNIGLLPIQCMCAIKVRTHLLIFSLMVITLLAISQSCSPWPLFVHPLEGLSILILIAGLVLKEVLPNGDLLRKSSSMQGNQHMAKHHLLGPIFPSNVGALSIAMKSCKLFGFLDNLGFY